ncbi:MAG: M20 family metallopeptidase, partial [Dehalococcoidia bacterium]|nr:M20 family metallopeptidase [Dehalococcoidia bacterium]
MVAPTSPAIRPAVGALIEEAVAVRRDLHRHPELSTEERRTQRVILEKLRRLGLEDVRPAADTGAIGLVRGARPGPNLLWRADIDALPLKEETGLPFASEDPGAMHACGHDGHVAIALAMAAALQSASGGRDSLAGTVRFAFQPAEERIGGARRMIDEGIMDDPKVDRVVGLHIMADFPAGEVRVNPGPIFADATHFRIIIRGRGGHAAAPQETIDPVIVAAHAIVALQTVVSRNVDPGATAVLSIGRLEAGARGNIIPDEAKMSGTVRTFEPDVRERILRRMDEILRGVASAFGAECQFDHSTLPAVVNDAACAALVERVAAELLGPERVGAARLTGADDMSLFLEAAPGAYFLLGGRNEEKGIVHPHHHAKFDFDE